MNGLFYCISLLVALVVGFFRLSLILDLKIVSVYGLNSERGVGVRDQDHNGWEQRGKHVWVLQPAIVGNCKSLRILFSGFLRPSFSAAAL